MRKNRGIYLLPNLFTTTSIFCGFYSIVSSVNLQFEAAAIAIIIAVILDGLDGPIARLTNTETDFGVQYDSLADMVSFGVAPALMVYQWTLSGIGKVGWLAAFFYTAATALRLARFNIQSSHSDREFSQGLPSPAPAGFLASFIWLVDAQGYTGLISLNIVTLLLILLSGLLMVSNIRYYKLNIELRGRIPFFKIILLVLFFMLIAVKPPLMLSFIGITYIISGPLASLIALQKYRMTKKAQD